MTAVSTAATSSRMGRHLKLGAAALMTGLMLAACSTTDGADKTPPTQTPPPQVKVTPPPQDGPARDTTGFLKPRHLSVAEPVRVAILVPMSGQAAPVGKAMMDAAQLALFEFDDPNILLMPKDTAGNPATAATAAREAIAEGADIILGPLFASSVAAVSIPAQQAQVPVIAFSTDRNVAGGGVYLLSFLPEDDIERIVDFAVLEGHQRFAALLPQNEYGQRVRTQLSQAITARGAQLTATETYAGSTDGMLAPAERLAKQKENYDIVLLPAGGTELQALAPLLPYYDVDPREVKFIGTGLWDDPSVLREPSLVGGWFAAPPTEARTSFQGRFEQVFGTKPHRIASLAYDAMSLAIALSSGTPGQRYTVAELTAEDGFAGIDGVFRFTPQGLNERALTVKEVRPGGFVVVSPAPQSLTGGAVF
ncbi:penicillin-binding protein activator [Pyruvatibacter mobilis]|jgi:branched-chain amino acid transport system substrate-binding protein|uniref:ABC transporter substrate-binding protein n=1 Tax=Pyruvatibacter mobilis TaxID=1712261 RepID=A0A845QAJ0_9HYPH|nr:penicillin-binding protein activator [Pyruvatibacter mobilis]NBG95101.1 ABC transporter substrate-binding protein [Pyruvatibacter mobilis]QJD76287.1 penicillin-binding protein activator [Pyruvatibacter mobilis]